MILIFPGEGSVTLEELAKQCDIQHSEADADCDSTPITETKKCDKYGDNEVTASSESELATGKRKAEYDAGPSLKKPNTGVKIAPFDRVVFIDSTWNQTKKIFMDERLRGR